MLYISKYGQIHAPTAFPEGKERQQPLVKRLRSTTTQEKLNGLVTGTSDKALPRRTNIRCAVKINYIADELCIKIFGLQ
jgi:hypothetical protein